MSNITIKTNNVPRILRYGYEMPEKYRKDFDYLDWEAIDKGEDSALFFRYKGQLYDIGEFMRIEENNEDLKGWSGYSPDSFFSGTVVKCIEGESVIVGRYFC